MQSTRTSGNAQPPVPQASREQRVRSAPGAHFFPPNLENGGRGWQGKWSKNKEVVKTF